MNSSNIRPIDQFVSNILNTQFEKIDPETIRQAKLRVIDTIGCLFGGVKDLGNMEFLKLIAAKGGPPEATVLVYGDRLPVGSAAMINCILCRSFDYEPVSPVVDGQLTPAHISGTNVMTAINLAEFRGVSGKELLTSMLVGDDMIARILATSGFDIGLGWDGNGTTNVLGATAIAGRQLGLNEVELKNALGLCLNLMGGTMQNIWDGTPAYKLPQGLAAQNAVFAAQLAKTGWTGPDDALFSSNGYFSLYTNGVKNPEVLTKDIGKIYYSDRAIKPYPGCRATHAPISAAIAFKDKFNIPVGDIQEVFISMPERSVNNFCGKPLVFGRFPHADTMFSYQYTVATALKNGSVKPEHYSEEALDNSDNTSLAARISLRPNPENRPLGIEIRAYLKNGSEIVGDVWMDDNKGDFITNPLSETEFYEKFMGNVSYSKSISKDRAEEIFETLQKLEVIEDIKQLPIF